MKEGQTEKREDLVGHTIDHKNIEQFRYYISRDMRRIEEKVDNDNSNLLGCFVASIVDILIVTFFQDYLNKMAVLPKLGLIFGFVLLFVTTYKAVKWIQAKWRDIRKTAGRDTDKRQEIIRIVDEFDNIAMNGLLICIYYKDKYEAESFEKLKRLYFSECFHYLDKSCSVYRKIAGETGKYINTIDSELISKYRVENYLELADELASFINDNVELISDKEWKIHFFNVKHDIQKWKEAYKKLCEMQLGDGV